MKKSLPTIDELLKNLVNNYDEDVPPELWLSIEYKLAKKQAPFYKKKVFLIRAAIILTVVAVGIISLVFFSISEAKIIFPTNSTEEIIVTKDQANNDEIEDNHETATSNKYLNDKKK